MKMTLLGTGVRTPFVLHGLADREAELGLTEVVLHDTDHERLRIMSALGAHLLREWGPASPSVASGIRARRSPARASCSRRSAWDRRRLGRTTRIALEHGVLGQETTGPGGFAMALRTIPVMLRYAELIGEVEPDALVVNFTNPVGIIAQALCDHSSIRVSSASATGRSR